VLGAFLPEDETPFVDKGIFLEISGFLLYVSYVRVRLAKKLVFLSKDGDVNDVKDTFGVIAIMFIIFGLMLQFTFFNQVSS